VKLHYLGIESRVVSRGGKIMIENRPEFDKITSFDEFNKYYWYREELSQICKSLGLEYKGTKQELNYIIEQYFKGNLIKKSSKVKKENDLSFTIQDMLKVYYGKSDYAKYDNSVCQWNQFLKDFSADENSRNYSNKLKVASILWKEVRNSKNEKIYSKNLLTEYAGKIKEYCK